ISSARYRGCDGAKLESYTTDVCSKRAGTGTTDNRRAIRVSLFRESGKGPLHTGWLCGHDRLLHHEQSRTGDLEIGDCTGEDSRDNGCTYAGPDGNFSRYPARPRSADSASSIDRFSVSWQPLDFGIGHGLDLGIVGSGAR